MITLDYRTNNPRWGTSGMAYASWERFAFALGYLANEAHYRNKNDRGMTSRGPGEKRAGSSTTEKKTILP